MNLEYISLRLTTEAELVLISIRNIQERMLFISCHIIGAHVSYFSLPSDCVFYYTYLSYAFNSKTFMYNLRS